MLDLYERLGCASPFKHPPYEKTEQSGTQSARERAFAAEPLGDPPLSPVRLYLSCNANVYRRYPYIDGFSLFVYNGEVFTNIYPQIVPQETYDIVRKKIDSNHYGKRSTEVVYLLRHKMKCGYCGSPVSAECGTAKNGERKRYYKCLGRKNSNGCKKSQARKEVLENYVLENIIMQLSNNMDYIVSELMTMQENYIKSNSALTRLVKEQRATENSINNIMTAIENGGTSNTAMKRLRELEEKNAELEKQIRIEQSHSAFKLDRKEITDFYKFALEQEPKMLINLLVKEIRLFDDKMIIVYNTPRTISLDESQGFSFYTDNVPYPIYIQNVKQPRMIDFQLIMRI